MKRILTAVTLIISLVTVNAETEKPNILFIFADDMAYETIGAYDELDIDTPNLDKLVKSGTSFSHAYNMGSYNAAVCVASRSMLVTGRSLWEAEKVDYQKLIENKESWPLQMKQAGYDTYMTSKWHVKTDPKKHFDTAIHIRKGMPKSTPAVYNRPKSPEDYKKGWKPWDKSQLGFWRGGKHWSVITADDTIGFIKEAAKKDKPFFIYTAFNAPHDPRQAPKSFIDQYPLSRVSVPVNFLPVHPYAEALCGKGLRDERLMPYPRTKYAVKVNRQEYFALISHMDLQIGRILDSLKASGKMQNTYIIFTADHGLAVGHHGLAGKQNLYEHSTKVPFIITGPGIKKNDTIDSPIYLQDVAPTTLELAGKKAPDSYFFKSLIPLLENPKATHYKHVFGSYLDRQTSITVAGWKLIHIKKVDVYELYDLKNDPAEKNNLADDAKYAKKKAELLSILKSEDTRLRSLARSDQ